MTALLAIVLAAAGHYVAGPAHTKVLEPPRTLACSGHVALQKRTFFFRKPGNDDWDLPAARCGHDYVVSYDAKVHGRRKGRRDFAVSVAPRGA
jgi:hypothetical protein